MSLIQNGSMRFLGLASAICGLAGLAFGDEAMVRGRVVDERGEPVAGAAVGWFWRANGSGKGPDGRPLDLNVPENVQEFWGNLGRMEPSGRDSDQAESGPDGRFAIRAGGRRHVLMAMDRDRKRGGCAVLPKGGETAPVEIRIGPTAVLRGSLSVPGAGDEAAWTHVYLNFPEDPVRPLASTRLVSCGSFKSKFAMSLPPGRYVLQGYNETLDARLDPDREVVIPPGATEVDLGVLALSRERARPEADFRRYQESSAWIDVERRFGKPAPEWSATDARGVPKGVRVQDFRGKWLLIYFWGFECAPCLGTDLPALARFYEERRADRDRFEVVAVCVAGEGDPASMAEVDHKLTNIVEHAWGGKVLPFPIILDASYRSMENFGVATMGPVLVDPTGNLMKGGRTELADKLDEAAKRTSR
ncbi:Thiol-disulfide oxidoreductase ResA [Planctomyces sp. SH-PL62]|nr:Thiol-disulfide oxidoreductase ResA [Planctomyces sp. SH-PL62]